MWKCKFLFCGAHRETSTFLPEVGREWNSHYYLHENTICQRDIPREKACLGNLRGRFTSLLAANIPSAGRYIDKELEYDRPVTSQATDETFESIGGGKKRCELNGGGLEKRSLLSCPKPNSLGRFLATVPLGQKVSPFRKAAQNVRCTHTVWELDVSGSPRTVTPHLRPHWPSRLSSLTSRRSEEEGEVKKPRAKEKE